MDGHSQRLTALSSIERSAVKWRDRGAMVDEIDKRTRAVTPIGPYSTNLTSITADQYGYVTLSFGSFRGSRNEFIVVGPTGSAVEDGDVSQFMLNTVNAVLLNP